MRDVFSPNYMQCCGVSYCDVLTLREISSNEHFLASCGVCVFKILWENSVICYYRVMFTHIRKSVVIYVKFCIRRQQEIVKTTQFAYTIPRQIYIFAKNDNISALERHLPCKFQLLRLGQRRLDSTQRIIRRRLTNAR